MEITFRCPACDEALTIIPNAGTSSVRCACGADVDFTPSASIVEKNTIDTCPRCTKSVFFVQRDFNQKLGLAVMIVVALVGLVFVYYRRPMYFYACLAFGALVDLAFYRFLPEITICYACKTTFRGPESNPEHQPFDLHIADVYDNRSKG